MFAQSALVAEIARLQRFSLRLTRNKADADDLVQATCLRALENSHLFKDDTNLFAWTSKIMFNLFLTNYRRRTKFESRYDPELRLENASVQPMQDIGMELADVKRAMTKLSPEHREILALVCARGLGYEEVSEMLQLPLGTIRSRLSRARAQLQGILDRPFVPVTCQATVSGKSANRNVPVVTVNIAS